MTLRSTSAGASRRAITASGRPSSSRSPTARPRPRIGRANAGAGRRAEASTSGRRRCAAASAAWRTGRRAGRGRGRGRWPGAGRGGRRRRSRPGRGRSRGRGGSRTSRPSGTVDVLEERPAHRGEGDRRSAEEVADDEVVSAVAVEVAERDAHARERLAAAVERDARGDADLLETSGRPGSRRGSRACRRWRRRCRASRRRPGRRRATPRPRPSGRSMPADLRDVGEGAVAVVAVEPVGLGGEVLGAAVVAAAVGGGDEGGGGGVVVEVGGDVEVEVAVAVEVGEGGGGAPEVARPGPRGR